MMLETMREKQLNVRLSPEEWARLDRVAAHHGLNAANVVRLLVKQADDELTRRAEVAARNPRWEESIRSQDPELWDRVLKAWAARCERENALYQQPSEAVSTIDSNGLIVLRNAHGEMARWRLRGGKLFFVQK